MLQNLVRGLCRKSGGVILVAGAIGVLTGVEHFMSGRAVAPQPRIKKRFQAKRPGIPKPFDRFSIRRTQSELGYTYWVLQGFGKYRGFTLFDTWQEAIDEIQRRTGTASQVQELAVLATAAV
jgi:hypothetical protein